jgi:autotransporter translocation and assembly factor TamB
MSRLIRRLAIVGAVIIGSAAAVALAGTLYINTSRGQEYLQGKISTAMPGSMEWRSGSISPLNGTMEVRNGVIHDPANDVVAGFDRLVLHISWFSWLRGGHPALSCVLEKPWAHLKKDATGTINLTRAVVPVPAEGGIRTEKESSSSPPVVVEELILRDGSLRFETADGRSTINIEEIDLTARVDRATRSGTMNAHMGRGRVDLPDFQTDIVGASVKATVNKGRIAPLVARITLPFMEMNLSGSVTDFTGTPRVKASAEGSVSLRELARHFGITSEITGNAALRCDVAGSLDNPEGRLRLDYQGGTIVHTPVDRLVLDLTLVDRLVSISALKILVAQGAMEGKGTVDLRQAFLEGFQSSARRPEAIAYALSLEGTDVHLDQLSHDGGQWRGVIDPSLSITGTGVSLRGMTAGVAFTVTGRNVGTAQMNTGTNMEVRGKAVMHRGVVELTKCSVRAGMAAADGRGSWDILSGSIGGNLSLAVPDLPLMLPLFGINDISGMMEATASLSGTTTHPLVDVDIHGERMRYRHIALGTITGKARLDRSGTLTLSPWTIRSGSSTVRATATSRLYGPGTGDSWRDVPFTLNVEGESVRLEDFIDSVATGTVSLTGRLEGTVEHSRGAVKLQGRDLLLYGQKITGIDLSATIDGGALRIDDIKIVVTPTESITGRGWISRGKDYELTLASQGLSLHSVDAIQTRDLADGLASFHISGKGSLDNPQFSGTVDITNVIVRGKAINDVKLAGTLEDHILRLSGRLNFDLHGSFDVINHTFSLNARFDDTDLSPYVKAAGVSGVGGQLTGTIKAAGNIRSLTTVTAEVSIGSLHMHHNDRTFLSAGNASLSVRDGIITIPDTSVILPPDGVITIGGRGIIGGEAAFRAEGTIPLTIAGRFIEEISDITGIAVVNARLDGPLHQPRINGAFEFDRVALTVPVLVQKLHDLKGTIRIDRDTVVLDGIKGSLDTGSFSLGGTVSLHRWREPERFALTFSAVALPLRVPETVDLLLTSNLRIEGTRENSLMKGNIIILEGTYYRDIQLNPIPGIMARKREIAPPGKGGPLPFVENMALDIVIGRRSPFMIDNNLATMTVNPDLRLVGTVSRPLIRGRAAVESGTVRYQGKLFDIEKGVIDFIDPYKIDPLIEVMSTTTVRDWVISLHISGTADQLGFTLTSAPPEEHGDILSLLLFGRTTGEMIAQEGGTTESTEQMLAGLIASTFGKDIKKASGLDIFEVETAQEHNNGPLDHIKVTLGKNLLERTTVRYSVESKEGAIVQRTITEYKIFEHILARGFRDTRGVYGGELQFRIEFR